MRRYYCTYFDSVYLPRGLALLRSLRVHASPFDLWVLCLDEQSYTLLTALAYPEVHPIRLEELEQGDVPLAEAKGNRSRVEYYFTLTPTLPLWILDRNPHVEVISYIDADLFVFSSVRPLFDELGEGSVLIIEHRFPARLHGKGFDRVGRFNVGWLTFRRNDEGMACLRRWRDQCLEWCYDRPEDGKFADQKYLDEWPARYPSLVVLQHKGANVAPWNVESYHVRVRGTAVSVDGQPLMFYHFQGLKKLYGPIYESGLGPYKIRLRRSIRRGIYRPYLKALDEVTRELRRATGFDAALRTRRLPHRPTTWLKVKGFLEFVRDVVLRGTFVISVPERREHGG